MDFVLTPISKNKSSFFCFYKVFDEHNNANNTDCRYSLPSRQEVFQKVERQYLLGLRAKDPEMRKKFFSLYHESLGKTLFTRLQYIIQIQDWEALSDCFWLKQGLDLLLAILVEDKPITLAPNSAKVPPLMVSGTLADGTGVQPMVTDLPEDSEEAPLTFDSLVLKQSRFLSEMSKLQVNMHLIERFVGTSLHE